ncbi:MAG: hypothetical protein MJK04_32065, partial [Psychrosphaera sp.]|nr:hypothetical protein [Psychrosphaera sp.]
IKRSLLGLTLGLSAISAQASQWVPIGMDSMLIFVPVVGLGDIQTDTFHYGNEASVVFNDVGQSSAVYYRVQDWVGDKATGGYDATDDWQCFDQTQLAANNNTLTLTNITSGRYQVTASAVMESGAEICDVAAYKAGQFNSADATAPVEFMVINHTTLDHTNINLAYLSQPNTAKYDLHARWLPVTGSDSYQLNLNRDAVDYALPIDADTYAQNTYYIVEDIYDELTDTFTPHTGFGSFTFSVQYQLNGQLSNAIAYTSSTAVRPLEPLYLIASDYLTFGNVSPEEVKLQWQADRRTPFFRVREQNLLDTPSVYEIINNSFPGPATIIEERDDGRNRYYNQLVIYTESKMYSNRYKIMACIEATCITGKRSMYKYDEGIYTMKPIPDTSAEAAFMASMDGFLINPGEHGYYVGEESGDYLDPLGLVANNNSPIYTSIGPGDSSEPRTPTVSDEILNRMEVNPEINAETTALLGEQIDLNSGSVSFTHTDVSLPGNSGLPVSISRTHKGGNY